MIKLVSVQYHFAAVLNSGVFHWNSSDLANHPVSCCVLWACAKCFNEHFEVPSKVAKSKGCSAEWRNFRCASDKSENRDFLWSGEIEKSPAGTIYVQDCAIWYIVLNLYLYSIHNIYSIYNIYIIYYIYDTWMFLNVLDPFHHNTRPSLALARLSHPVGTQLGSSNIQQVHWALEMVGSTISIWLWHTKSYWKWP